MQDDVNEYMMNNNDTTYYTIDEYGIKYLQTEREFLGLIDSSEAINLFCHETLHCKKCGQHFNDHERHYMSGHFRPCLAGASLSNVIAFYHL